MKKLVKGLIGIIITASGLISGCQSKLSIDGEANKIIYHFNSMKNVAGVELGETFDIYDFENGKPLQIIINGEKNTRIITFYDKDKNGKYDKKETLTIPKKWDIYVILPDSNSQKENDYKDEPEENIFKEKRNIKGQSVAYNY
ncbi:MAG: hypothetical protein AABW67_03230 [Nanoarchaeota archaeon]